MSSVSSRIREIEHQSLSVCEFQNSHVKADLTSALGEWKLQPPADNHNTMETTSDAHHTLLQAKQLTPGTTLRVAPMDRKCGGWDAEHFHLDFQPPSTANSFFLTFEATARECITVGFSPEPHYSMGKTYAIHIGAGGNLTTVIRRWLPSGEECVESTYSTIRICTDFIYKSYWILFHSGIIYVGTGNIPGRQCVAKMDDSLYDQLRPGQDKVRYIGFGNSSLHRHARDLKIRNIILSEVPPTLDVSNLTPDPSHDLSSAAATSNEDYDLLQQYHQECAKAQSRALKYNTPIDSEPPGPDAFLKWSEARRLRANPEPGFITGIDVTSQEESDKRRKRKERFERDQKRRMEETNDDMDGNGNADRGFGVSERMEDVQEEDEKVEEQNNLSAVQAYDNIDYIRKYRMDPPSGEMSDDVQIVPEKIHLFAIDWAAFKQMRSDDIMAYFSIYGPSYVEWLSELSCNVMFQDKFSAIRAMQAMSQEIPFPPPPTENDTNTDANADASTTDANPMDETKTEESTEPPTSTPPSPPTPLEDLGSMGWRFCTSMLNKKYNDRFGRKGTKSRFLVREASSLDILEHRPTETPRPPPGFTTRAVLGPGSDFPNKRQRGRRGGKSHSSKRERDNGQRSAKRRRRNNREYQDMEEDNVTMDGVPAALDQGLKARR